MAIVEVIGCLIKELADSEDLDANDTAQTKKQVTGLYDLLLERMMDVSSYVRTKVLSVLSKLCDLPVKFPKQRLALTRAAVGALEDKASGVRKGAAGLLVKLLLTHPYGLMHGGMLALEEWEGRYKVVKEELAKVEEGMGNVVKREDGEGEGTGVDGDGNGDEQGAKETGDEEESEDDESADESPKKKKSKK